MESSPARAEVLTIGFAGNVARVFCADASLRRLLVDQLRHCLVKAPLRTESLSDHTGGDGAIPTLAAVHSGDGLFRIERAGEVVAGGLGPADAAERVVYEITLSLASSCQQLLVLHAAGLALGERGLVLCGESGSGKSTVAAHLVAAGWDLLSDELVAIAPDGGDLVGFPRALNLKDVAPLAGLPGVAAAWEGEGGPAPGQVVHLDPEQLRPGCVRDRALPALVVCPRFAAGALLEVRPLSPAETAYRLLPRLLNGLGLPDRGFAAAAGLARRLPAWSVAYGDAATAAAQISALAGAVPRPG